MRNDRWRRWLRLRRDRLEDVEDDLRFPRDPQADRVPILLRLSVRLLPADVREEILGDLLELWRDNVRQRPWACRVLWLFRQPLATVVSRLRFGRRKRKRIGLASAGRSRAGFSWLDVKLGVRMMLKYPGVSLVIVFALAIGIPVSLMPNHLIDAATGESPPFDQGERVVGIIGLGHEGRADLRLGDYERLRGRLTTFGWLGAAMPAVAVNIISGDGRSDGERGALVTASLFAIARVPPMMGRVLVPADEVEGAPDVAVVGYDFWRGRLGGDPGVLGTTLRIAGVPTTIVGVIPEGFAMPSTEQVWLPLRHRSADYATGWGRPFGFTAGSPTGCPSRGRKPS